jgi:hypothetical protein
MLRHATLKASGRMVIIQLPLSFFGFSREDTVTAEAFDQIADLARRDTDLAAKSRTRREWRSGPPILLLSPATCTLQLICHASENRLRRLQSCFPVGTERCRPEFVAAID